MYKLGIISDNKYSQLGAVEKEIKKERLVQPIIYRQASSLVDDFNAGNLSALLFNLHTFNDKHLSALSRLKEKNPQAPMIVLSDQACPEAKRRLLEKNDTVMLMRNEYKDLAGVVRKSILRQTVHMRKHTRNPVDLDGDIITCSEGKKYVKIVNLSKGGAMLLTPCKDVDESFFLDVSLYLGTKSHRVLVQKRWVREHSAAQSSRWNTEVGVEFVA